ncbi:YadA family autotransporter adhesin [Paraburkholderia acidicola]|nr:hypothetical protein [Paraburkholderia acidicola]
MERYDGNFLGVPFRASRRINPIIHRLDKWNECGRILERRVAIEAVAAAVLFFGAADSIAAPNGIGHLVLCDPSNKVPDVAYGLVAKTVVTCSDDNLSFMLVNSGSPTGNDDPKFPPDAAVVGYLNGKIAIVGKGIDISSGATNIFGPSWFHSNMDLGGNRITGLAEGLDSKDAVNVGQLQQLGSAMADGLKNTQTLITSLSTTMSTGLHSTGEVIAGLSTGLGSVTGSIGSLSTGLAGLTGEVSTLQTSMSTAVVSTSNVIGSLSTGLGRTDREVKTLSTSTSTGLGQVKNSLGQLETTAQLQAQQVDSVSKRVELSDQKIATMADQLAPLTRAEEGARRNGGSLAATVVGGGAGRAVETLGATLDNTAKSLIDPAGCTVADGVDSTATGLCAKAGTPSSGGGADGATVYGAYAEARASHGTAMGFRALAARQGAVAIGYQARASGDPTVAIGDNAVASGDYAVALGASASASGENAVALGAGSIADRPNSVSIGSPGRERRLANLAPGVMPGDAVNLSQLEAVRHEIGDVAHRAYSGVAMSMAMTGAYLPSLNPGEVAAGVGVGGFSGYGAIALNVKGLASNGSLGWGAGVSTTGSVVGFNFGAGWKW